MNVTRLCLLAAALLIPVWPAPVAVRANAPAVARDLPYRQLSGVDPNLLSLDVYSVPTAAGQPVMVYVHGGGWQTGDKSRVGFKPEFFQSQGFVFVSVNYRLSPEAAFPAHAEDVAAALAWVRDRVARYGGDPAQLYLMGHSAGAHLAALVATDGRFLAAHGMAPADLRGVISLDTQAYDLPALAEAGGGRLPAAYRVPFGEDAGLWGNASPIVHVRAGAGIPPMAVAYSGGSGPRPNPQRAALSARFADALRAAGVPALLIGSPEQSHAQINQNFGAPGNPVAPQALDFLETAAGEGGR